MLLPRRKTQRLRRGRISNPGDRYFITFCTKNRVALLTDEENGSAVIQAVKSSQGSGDFELIAATLMPDHVHLLLTLGHRLTVGQVAAKIKTLSRDQGKAAWRWQDEGFEHRVRTSELIEDYGLYIFMNPYRAGLCPLTAPWPWWLCPDPSKFLFLDGFKPQQGVPMEWLGHSDKIARKITTGD